MFQDLKVDTRRIPNRLGDEEVAEPSPIPPPIAEPTPLAALPLVEEPAPPPIAAEPIPIPPIVVEEPAVPAAPRAEPRAIMEVEYWWDTQGPPESTGQSYESDESCGWAPEVEIHR
jgi:hypothetical protein